MTRYQLASLLRAALNVAGGVLAATGTVDGEAWQQIAGGITALAGVAWGLYSHRNDARPDPGSWPSKGT